ncbi:MAG: hydroxymethylbilane synthase [Myxococcota bacterium]
MTSKARLRLGTRGSQLALTQSKLVAHAVTNATGIDVELVVISTKGDRIKNIPLPAIGGKGLFTAELESSLRDGGIDFAVHSLKDLPTDDPDGLILGAIPTREDPRDCLVGPALADLSEGAVVGSGSLRRREQLLQLRSDLVVNDIRGNVHTRLEKRDRGDFEATVLAMAGLARLGIDRPDMNPLSVDMMVPAVGQGALGVQCRDGDPRVLECLTMIDHEETRACVSGERVFLAAFGGGCNVPAGCHIVRQDGRYKLYAFVAKPSGEGLRIVQEGDDPISLGAAAAEVAKA